MYDNKQNDQFVKVDNILLWEVNLVVYNDDELAW